METKNHCACMKKQEAHIDAVLKKLNDINFSNGSVKCASGESTTFSGIVYSSNHIEWSYSSG